MLESTVKIVICMKHSSLDIINNTRTRDTIEIESSYRTLVMVDCDQNHVFTAGGQPITFFIFTN